MILSTLCKALSVTMLASAGRPRDTVFDVDVIRSLLEGSTEGQGYLQTMIKMLGQDLQSRSCGSDGSELAFLCGFKRGRAMAATDVDAAVIAGARPISRTPSFDCSEDTA